ncbi:SdrD B-like domain-containing protein, partial [Lewinella cohaerens]|uniref:SdrD B-like domain-containing protein n=1 Tax=Lewinella cohaerens TaxID=70995 RepID=UPI003CCBFF53
MRVNVNPLPTPSITGDLEICQGESTTLTASGGTSYLWSTGATTESITVNPASTSTYTVTATNGNNCTNTASATVIVNDNPVAALSGNPLVCNGQSTTLTATGAGADGAYAWSTGATTATISVSPTGIETYTVTVTNANGCTDETSITVNEAPTPTVVAASIELCAGEFTTLTASGGSTYQWGSNGNDATTAAITVTPLVTTTYNVTVTNAAGCANEASVTITVLEQPEITDVAVVQPTSCNGTENGSLTVNASGNSATLQYRINGGAWQASNIFAGLGAGTYNVEVSYTGARCMVGPTTVTLNPVVPPAVSVSPDVATCAGNSTTLVATGNGGTGNLTYTWMPGNQTGASITVTPAVTTTFTATVLDELGCSSTDAVTITVNENPVASLTKTDATCGQDNGTVAVGVSGGEAAYQYTWSPNVSTTATATNLAVGTYNVTVTDANSCFGTATININNLSAPSVVAAADQTICEGSNATLSATTTGGTAPVTLTWMPGNLSGNDLTVAPITTTTYTVTATDANGCTATDQMTINVDPAFVSGINAPASICAEEGVLFSAAPAVAGATYSWTFNGSATPTSSTQSNVTVSYATPGSYTATLVVSRGLCTETYVHNIEITQAVFASGGPDQTMCQGGEAIIGLPEGEAGPVGAQYTWTPNLFLENDRDPQTTASPPFDFTYTLTVEQNGCVRTQQVRVTVDVNKNPIADAGADITICPGEEVVLGGTPSGTPPPAEPSTGIASYSWSPITGLDDATLANPTLTANVDETFELIVTATTGCTDTASVNVTILDCGIIGDFVWEDDNANGIQNIGESGVAGISVELLDTDDNVLATTSTNASGYYEFTNLPSATYKVAFDRPLGYIRVLPNIGSDDSIDSDANLFTGITNPFTLAPGETNNDIDAGLYRLFTQLGDLVFKDLNGNGQFDAGEPGIEGVTVNLYNDVPEILSTTTTDENGIYGFYDLEPGNYEVEFTLPTGYSFTSQFTGGDNLKDSNANPVTGRTGTLTLDSGKGDITIDAGLVQFDLALDIAINGSTPGPYSQGSQVDFAITVTNEGSIIAQGTEVTDYLPAGLTIIGFDANGTTVVNNGDGTFTIPSLDPLASVTFIVETTINANFQGTSLTNGAEITTDSGGDIDSTPANDLLSEDDQDEVTLLINQTAGILIEKATNGIDADALPGVILLVDPTAPPTVTWTYVVTNIGSVDITNVVVNDDQEGQVGTIGTLAAGASQTFTQTGIAGLGTYSNLATATADNPLGGTVTDTDPSNYTGAFINVEKVADRTEICAGEEVNFTLTVRLLGGADGFQLREISVEDTNLAGMLMPGDAYFVAASDLNGNGYVDFIDNNNDGVSDEEFVWEYSVIYNTTTTNIAMDEAELWYVDPTNSAETYQFDVMNTDAVTVDVNPLPVVTFSGDTEICNGESTTITASGGTSYLWSTTETTPSITVAPTGTATYDVTVTDGNGCVTVSSVQVVVNDNPVASLVGNPLVCEKEVTVLTAAGAGAGGSYLWSTTETTESITVNPQTIQTYSVTVTDANGCTDDVSVTVTEAPEPIVIAASTEICSGDGELITLVASGGGTYQWDANAGNATTAEVDVLPIVTTIYNVTVTSDGGCAGVANVTITVVENPEITDVITVDPTACDGNDNGSITIIATDNSDDYDLQYRINGGIWQASNVFTGLGAGSYNIEVSYEESNCIVTGSEPTMLNDAVPPTITANADHAICIGETTMLTASSTGGTGTITYVWEPGTLAGDNVSVSPVATTTYTVTGTDELGCSNTDVVVVTVNSLPQLNVVKTDAACGQSNGEITVNVTQATAPLTFTWLPNVGNTGTVTGLAAGDYTVMVEDANGCSEETVVTINELSAPTISVNADATVCEGDMVTLTAVTGGGTGALSVVWMPGNLTGNNVTVTANATQTYTATVTDTRNCTATDEVTITVDPSFVSGITGLGNLCAEEPTTFTATPVDGATYNWTATGPATPASGTGETFTMSWGDTPGVYTVTLTVTRGTCVRVYTQDVNISMAVFADAGDDKAICQGGSVQIGLPQGQSAPIGAIYTWSPDNGTLTDITSAQPVASPLVTTTYTMTVTLNNCTRTDEVTVVVDPDLNPVADAGDDLLVCAGTEVTLMGNPTGTVASANPGDGIAGYIWSPLNDVNNAFSFTESATFTANADGNYQVIVFANSGCTDTAFVNIAIANPIVLTGSSSSDADCNGAATGSITLNVAGGTGNYVYDWGDLAGTNDPADRTNLTAETYTVTVSDDGGCSAIQSFTINQPTVLMAVADSVAVCGGESGTLTVMASGGVTPYTYQWSDGGGTDASATYTQTEIARSYTVTVTDANGCETTAVGRLTVLPLAAFDLTEDTLICAGETVTLETSNLFIYVGGPLTTVTFDWNTGEDTPTIDVTPASTQTYTVTVTVTYDFSEDEQLICQGEESVTVTVAPNVVIDADNTTVIDADCNGSSTGSIDLIVTSGTPTYIYSWTGPDGFTADVEDISGLAAGTYTVVVTDQNGCSDTEIFTITEPTVLAIDMTGSTTEDSDCNESAVGAIDLVVAGGTTPYTYLWNTGATSEDLSSLIAGMYTVTVTDDQGCTDEATFTIEEPTLLEVSATKTDETCAMANGTIDVTVNGGTSPYTYAWNDGDTTEDRSDLAPGTYTITVTDANNCTATTSITIIADPVPIVTVDDVTLCADEDATLVAVVSSGTPPYTYLWSNGGTSSSTVIEEVFATNTYTVTVTDADGCTATATGTVNVNSLPVPDVSDDLTICEGESTTLIVENVFFGTPPFTYEWWNATDPGTILSTTTELTVGPAELIAGQVNNFFVRVTDANGCKERDIVMVEVVPNPTVTVTDQTICAGETATLVAVPGAGNGNYTYLWGTGETTASISVSPVATTNYSVTVTSTYISSDGGVTECTDETTASVIVEAIPVITSIVEGNATCGDINGIITFNFPDTPVRTTILFSIDGGATYPYSSLDNVGSFTITGLAPGTYDLWSSWDGNGGDCPVDLPDATIQDEPGPVITAGTTITPADCNGALTGEIDLSVSDGTAPLTYVWTGPGGFMESTEDISGLVAGTYTVVVTDANNCSDTESFTIEEPTTLEIDVDATVLTDADCNGAATGTIDLVVTGGTAPYTYLWNTGATSEDLTGLTAGPYTVTVTDDQGCTDEATFTIDEPTTLEIDVDATVLTDADCNGSATGTIDLVVTGGTAPYTYLWNTGATSEDLTGLTAGTYTVTVTDDQ